MKRINSVSIEKYEGLEQLLEKWDALSQNLKNVTKGAPIILPDIFLLSKSGTGRTEFVKFLSDYLVKKENLLDFYGDVNWFEFKLGYCHNKEPFTEIQRFIGEVQNAAGFRNEFRGIVFIDVDDWKKHCEERYFLDFLEYLSDNSDQWMIIISVSDSTEEERSKIGSILSCFLRLETITIKSPTVDELLEFACNVLMNYGITLGDDAKNVVRETIEALCHNKYFDWYKTVKLLCQNIAYTCYSEGVRLKTSLDAKDVLAFGKQSEFVNAQKKKMAKIGF